jgi:hypothetical protein
MPKALATGDPVEVRKLIQGNPLGSEPNVIREVWLPATVVGAGADRVAVAYADHSREVVERKHVRFAARRKPDA